MSNQQQKCFTITVDGKKYGPFLRCYRKHDKILRLEYLAGVELSDDKGIWLKSGWLPFEPPKPPRAKRDRSTPLLGLFGFDGGNGVSLNQAR